jgi:hypothetical protein
MNLESKTAVLQSCRRQGGDKCSSYSVLTSALDGVSGQRHPPAALCPWKEPPVPTGQEAWWAPEPFWTQRPQEKSFRLCQGMNPGRPVCIQDTTLTELPQIYCNEINTNITDVAYTPSGTMMNLRVSTAERNYQKLEDDSALH